MNTFKPVSTDRVSQNTTENNQPSSIPLALPSILGPFLKALADGLEKNELSPSQQHRIEKFYMEYLLEEQIEEDLSEGKQETKEVSFSDREFIQFLTMGFYIYKMLANS